MPAPSQPLFDWRIEAVDTIWGTRVEDPYRWLEMLQTKETHDWLVKQVNMKREERLKVDATYEAINDKLLRYGGFYAPVAVKEGPYFFQLAYSYGNHTPVLYYKKKEKGELLEAFDPYAGYNKKPVSIEGFSLSRDARYLAVSLSEAGSDWRTIKIRDLKKHKTLNDEVKWVKFSEVCWTDSGFYYSRFDIPPTDYEHIAPNTLQQLCFHKLGDTQQNDIVIYRVPQISNAHFHFDITPDNRYLILYTFLKLQDEWCRVVCYKDLDEGIYGPLNLLLASPSEDKTDYDVIDCINGKFVVRTNLDAPRYRVLLCDKDSVNHLEVFIEQYAEVLQSLHHVGGKLLGLYFYKGAYTAGIFDYTGEMVHGVKFPEGVNVSGFEGEPSDTVVRFTQNTFYIPPVVFNLNMNSNKTALVGSTEVHYDVDRYTTEIVIYKSKDGTEIPMYLTHKNDLKKSKNNPVILYGYGGFGVSQTPTYSFPNILFFENNGILAVPLIRGGGEFGDTWHEQGKGLNKQNSFDDFISAAEYLIDSGYTTNERLAIRGGSNGGLLVGAVITQRPDLCKVAIGDAGLYDMLRYHLFTSSRFIASEYGTPHDSIQFKNLLSYSPLHNVKGNIDYPATILVAGENDDRVPPFHSYKFLSALQDSSSSKNPHILYYELDAGHQGAELREDRMAREAFILAFMFKQMGIKAVTVF